MCSQAWVGDQQSSQSGAQCRAILVPCVWASLAPFTPTLASSLWGDPHLHTCPHLGLGLTLPPSHLPPHTQDHPKPVLLGIRPLPPTTQPPKPGLVGITALPLTMGPPKPALVGISSLPQPHDHPNLSLWASDLQRPPGTSGRAASTHLSPDPQAHRTETHTMGTQDASGPLVLSARLPPPCPPSHPLRGPTDRQSPWGC